MKATLNEKFIAYFALLSGIAISIVAMFYSVSGLVAIYPAALIPIVIMGVSIEVGKISMTLWLKQNWDCPWVYKLTMIPAVLILMVITSGGVFGFLSKAHSDQSLVSGEAFSKVQLIEDKITTVKENINTQRDNIAAARTALVQLDNQVNARLDRGSDELSAERSVQIRRNQRTERAALNKEISDAQNEIANLNNQLAQLNVEKAPFASELRKVEAEVGPVKYIAALLYGDNPDTNLLERAVRWVTLMIVLVLDPVAILLLLASQYSFQRIREKNSISVDTVEVKEVVVENTSTSTPAATTSTVVELSSVTSVIELPLPITVTEPEPVREKIKALPIEKPAGLDFEEFINQVHTEPVEFDIDEFIQSTIDEAKVDAVKFNETVEPIFDVVDTKIEDEIKINTVAERIFSPPVEEITTVEQVIETADSDKTVDTVSTEYVQNEEQKESNRWSSTALHAISQEQYLEKVRKLKGST